MITPCKMRLPEKDREEMSRRVQECCFAEGIDWEIVGKVIKNLDKSFWYIETFLGFGDTAGFFEDYDLPEIEPLDFLKKYEGNDATEILEQLVAEPDDLNLQMKTKDARNLFKREQVYADSQVKGVPRETIKRIIYIDDRPMSHRMGWEAE